MTAYRETAPRSCPLDYSVRLIVCCAYDFASDRRIDHAHDFPQVPRMARGNPASKAKSTVSEDDIGEIDTILGFHIRLAHGMVYRHFTETFTDLGLTQKQVSVLWLVDDHPEIAQADIGRRLQIDRATVMAIVNRLQKRGY